MKLGNLEIRWPRSSARIDTSVVGKDLTGVFAISEFEPWWMALHQTLNELEDEMIKGAYNSIGDKCIDAVRNAEGVNLVRQRLLEKRATALSQKKEVLQ